jgi:ribonucleoside-diphosphate reductase alpha chain
MIKKTGVNSQGVIPFLKIANDVTVAINRSGRRRGATCAYLETWHLDIEDFIELRRNTGDERRRTHDMNTANWIPDLFMKRVRDGGKWTLFSPDETPDLHHLYGKEFEDAYGRYEQLAEHGELRLHKQIKAKDLWRKMISMMFETGHPWMTWKDACNVRSPQDHAGVVHCSNLCTEITLNTSDQETAVCNLGSVNLSNHVRGGKLDVELLEKSIKTGMRMLDNVIDLNFYPTVEGRNANMRHRPVGLGVMGFQDALYKTGINFSSDEAIKFADESMEQISYLTISASCDLAAERGSYASFRGSKWDRGIMPLDTLDLLEKERGIPIPVSRDSKLDWDALRVLIKKNGMRNSNCLAVAPTATISNISGCFPTIEPIFKNIYVKSNMSGEFVVVNSYLIEDLKSRNLWNDKLLAELKQNDGSIGDIQGIPEDMKRKYAEVFDTNPLHLVKIAAHRGKWIDQSQSFNIFYKGTSGKDLSTIYMYAWEMGMKTTYYLRTMGATGVEKSTVKLEKKETKKISVPKAVAKPVPVKAVSPPAAAKGLDEPKLCRIEDPDCEACQ